MGPKKVDIVVVGAGISGLCVAYWMRQRGYEVVVLEKDSQVGGTMKSVREQGFLVETGPNSALETTPLFKELFAELGLQDELAYANPVGKDRFILRDGKLLALPLHPLAFLRTKLFSTSAKLRLLKEPFIGKAENEETIAQFVVRRLGQEFLDYAIDPFVAGVFAADPHTLSVRAAFPKLYSLEERYGSLIGGMIKGRRERKQRAEKAKDRAESFSFVSGMQALPNALSDHLHDRVLLHAKVTDIHDLALQDEEPTDEPEPQRYKVEFLHHGISKEIETDAVVFSCPSYVAATLLHSLSAESMRTLNSIPYAPVASVFIGFDRRVVPHPMNGFGFLVPSKERRRILGCLWSSSLFPNRAPEGKVALTVFVGGSRQPELALLHDDQLVSLVLEELKTIMQIEGKPVYLKPTRWEKAIPQYSLGHLEMMQKLSQFEEEHEGMFFCSNYRGGISVGDCLVSAHAVVQSVTTMLKRHERLGLRST